jgi:hypothetical protein|nr:ATP-grasp domain-containing protein [Neorhizobium tomejilense]
MYKLAFRLTDILDPEERLEEAALFKAISDHYGRDAVLAFRGDECPDPDLPVFGRNMPAYVRNSNPVPPRLDYWDDAAFLSYVRREFYAVPFDQAEAVVNDMLARGKEVFVKSARQKHFKMVVRQGENFCEKIGDMAYSFIDDGPLMLAQEFAHVEYEHRFFVIDRNVVTHSPNMSDLTPIDHPLPFGTVYRTPASAAPEVNTFVVSELERLAMSVAEEMDYPHACVDVAFINGNPGVVEFNPMQLGHLGLFACDVRALARASETLVENYCPLPSYPCPSPSDETAFLDI